MLRLTYLLFVLFVPVKSFATDNIVFIHSYDQELDWVNKVSEGFLGALDASENSRIFIEYMDAKRFPEIQHKQEFYNHLLYKYAEANIKAIAVSDDPALDMIQDRADGWLRNIPLVYMGINRVTEETLNLPNATGVFEFRDLAKTVIDIQAIFKTNDVIVITDQSATGLANLAVIHEGLAETQSTVQLHVIDRLLSSNITATVEAISNQFPVFIIGQLYDEKNNLALMDFEQGTIALNRALDNPLLTIGVPTLETGGALGGHSLSGVRQGSEAASLMRRVLSGEAIQAVPPILKATNTWYFNWQEMKRYRLSKADLPAESVVMFEDVSFYQQNKTFVNIIVSAFVAALVIIILLLEIVRRTKLEKKFLADNEAKYKDFASLGANVFWEVDASGQLSYIYGDTYGFLSVASGDLIGLNLFEVIKLNKHLSFPTDECVQKFNARSALNNVIAKSTADAKSAKIFSISGDAKYSTEKGHSEFLGYRGIVKEVTDEYLLTEKLAYDASHDSLTGLYNRRIFNTKLRVESETAQQSDTTAYLCFIDLDNFKVVNETIGHMAGDGLLKNLAAEIASCITNQDTLARLGGDEFGLILKGRDEQQALQTCQNIISKVTKYRFNWNAKYYSVGVSIGVVPISAELSFEEHLSYADSACYRAKGLGKGQAVLTNVGDADIVNEHIQMGHIANIQQALESNRFHLVRQEIRSLDPTFKGKKYELLLRYIDGDGTSIPPNLFIPMAEKHGLITLIDRWVIRHALNLYQRKLLDDNTQVSINISGVSLSNKEFLAEVEEILKQSSVSLSHFCFEVTETAVVANIETAINFIQALKKLGCEFSLDDFGSGASSYGYLKNLPIDYLKIDGSLIKSIETEFIDEVIVRSIHEIAHQMNIKTVAEFVENDNIMTLLKTIGIDFAQGYAVHRPEQFTDES